MAFFKKKEKPEAKKRSLLEIAHTRVLTAEGWRRKTSKKAPQKKSK